MRSGAQEATVDGVEITAIETGRAPRGRSQQRAFVVRRIPCGPPGTGGTVSATREGWRSQMRRIVAGLFMTLDGVVEPPESWRRSYVDAELAEPNIS
jgi:hypothetical protein